jgi:hypothetical protein
VIFREQTGASAGQPARPLPLTVPQLIIPRQTSNRRGAEAHGGITPGRYRPITVTVSAQQLLSETVSTEAQLMGTYLRLGQRLRNNAVAHGVNNLRGGVG